MKTKRKKAKGAIPAKKKKVVPARRRPRSAIAALVEGGDQVTDTITVDPNDFVRSMTNVLDVVKFRNSNGRKLVSFSVSPTTVTLLFHPV